MPTHAIVKDGAPKEVAVYQQTTTLNDAQIKALPTTAVELIAAVGANKILLFHNAMIRWRVAGGIYTNYHADASLNIAYGNGAFASCGDGGFANPTDTNEVLGFFPPYVRQDQRASWNTDCFSGNPAYPVSAFDNQPINIALDNGGAGDLTGGHANNTLEVTVFYSIVDL